MVSFQKHFNTGTRDLVTIKFIVNVTRDLVIPHTTKLLGGILVSLRPSVCPSVPHPVSALYRLQNFKHFLKICNFYFVLFWLGIWCEPLVWVIMGRWGVSQNAGVLVTVNLTVDKVFLKDYSDLVKHGKMLHSTCRNILRDFGSIFLNDVCSPKLHARANHSGTKK